MRCLIFVGDLLGPIQIHYIYNTPPQPQFYLHFIEPTRNFEFLGWLLWWVSQGVKSF